MITNLFAIFDPSTQIFNIELNWLSLTILLLLTPVTYWLSNNTYLRSASTVTQALSKEIDTLLGPLNFKGVSLAMVSLFLFIILINVLGLIPYVFTPTSHPIITVTLALPYWLALILFGWVNHTQHIFAHLVPQGTPAPLISFMVCIETVSNIIRPLTLSVRLAANIIAGHLLLTLLGNQGPIVRSYVLPSLLAVQLMLLTLESAVAIIQAYVFIVLITLYVRETSYDKP